MKMRKFQHQLGVATIKVYANGTAKFRGRSYSSYSSARRALFNFYGPAYEIKKRTRTEGA